MRILVTGGTGVIGAGIIPELLKQGHSVRLLSRRAESDARDYPERVEPFTATVTEPQRLIGAGDRCDAVIHIAGIVQEKPPDQTFQAVNVEGTKNMLAEAERAGVQRFVYISSLGVDRGQSRYHQSKRAAEELVTTSALSWTILRPGTVYGPGDEVISTLLKLVRSLPVVPVVGFGEQRFQPIWFEDLGVAAALSIDSADTHHKILELAGSEITTTRELIDKLGEVMDRSPAPVPVPTAVTRVAVRIAERFEAVENLVERSGLGMPITTDKLQMLLEENIIPQPEENALTHLFRLKPTPLDTGLRLLAEELPELLPEEGVGTMERKQFTVEIEQSKLGARDLLAVARERMGELMAIEFTGKHGASEGVDKGDTLDAKIPGRGIAQVRALEVSDCSLTFVTVEGHPLAGLVGFRTKDLKRGAIRFTIEVNARASNALDWIALRAVGAKMQRANWRTVANRIVELSGGFAPGRIIESSRTLSADEADEVNSYVAGLVRERARSDNAQESALQKA